MGTIISSSPKRDDMINNTSLILRTADLRTELQGAFVDLGHKKAFDLLLKAWSSEQAAMGNSTLPTVCDKLSIVSSVHNRKLIAVLTNELKEKDQIIQELENKIIELQDKQTYHDDRITA